MGNVGCTIIEVVRVLLQLKFFSSATSKGVLSVDCCELSAGITLLSANALQGYSRTKGDVGNGSSNRYSDCFALGNWGAFLLLRSWKGC
jgi:hypothetical protein